jgi:hypothetical protein
MTRCIVTAREQVEMFSPWLRTAMSALSWDDIGQRHPQIYGEDGDGDPRVRRAMQGYSQTPHKMPPLVLVQRHGVYQVADGHHRAEAANALDMPVKAYVAQSPFPNEPFSDGTSGPYHGAEPVAGIS